MNKNKTTDLWFGSFLKLKGYNPTDFNLISRNKGEFIFDIPNEEWKELKLLFDKSEAKQIKYAQESLKDLIYN